MENISKLIIVFTFIFIACTITGTLVWLLWDNTIPALFSGLVEKGYVSPSPKWFDVVKFSWIIGLLFYSKSDNKNK